MDPRATFDEVAELYDAMRPGYPEGLFADLAATAALAPLDPILELGCGSGQATVDLARIAGPVLALDPGAELVARARRRLGDAAEFQVTTFEAWPLRPASFRLVASAQAWHWIDPAVGFAKAAQALRPGGWLAIFGHVPMPPPADWIGDFQAIFARRAPRLWGPTPESWYLPQGPVAALISGSGLFGPVVHRGYSWTARHTPESFKRLYGTISHYNVLPADQRAALIDDMAALIAARGGTYDMAYETHLYMAPLKAGAPGA